MPKVKKTWKFHKAKWNNCTKCELCKPRSKVVLGKGQIPADILLVGEAPGEGEDTSGKPFKGPAGDELHYWLEEAVEAAGIETPRMFFTNIISCLPKIGSSIKLKEPPEWAVSACKPRLQEIVEIVRAPRIIMVGKHSQKWCPNLIDWDFESSLDLVHPGSIIRLKVDQYGLARQKTVVTIRDYFIKEFA